MCFSLTGQFKGSKEVGLPSFLCNNPFSVGQATERCSPIDPGDMIGMEVCKTRYSFALVLWWGFIFVSSLGER